MRVLVVLVLALAAYCAAEGDVMKCSTEADCSMDETCMLGSCVDPCEYFRCPNNTDCEPRNHKYTCVPSEPGRNKCTVDQDCLPERACLGGKCLDLCRMTVCDSNSVCKAADHRVSCVPKVRSSWPPAGAGKKLFYLNTLKKVTWVEAYMGCVRNNSRLARIENEEENKIVLSMIRQQGTTQNYWFGGSDWPEVGHYFWMATGEFVHGYFDWYPGQGRSVGTHRCLYYWMTSQDNIKWDDWDCGLEFSFVCEYYQ